jgi:hypothetical protein
VAPEGRRHREAPTSHLDRLARIATESLKAARRTLTQSELELAMKDRVKASAIDKRAGISTAIAKGTITVEDGPNRSRLHTFAHDWEDNE